MSLAEVTVGIGKFKEGRIFIIIIILRLSDLLIIILNFQIPNWLSIWQNKITELEMTIC